MGRGVRNGNPQLTLQNSQLTKRSLKIHLSLRMQGHPSHMALWFSPLYQGVRFPTLTSPRVQAVLFQTCAGPLRTLYPVVQLPWVLKKNIFGSSILALDWTILVGRLQTEQSLKSCQLLEMAFQSCLVPGAVFLCHLSWQNLFRTQRWNQEFSLQTFNQVEKQNFLFIKVGPS